MKELSIEEKACRYDEAIKIANEYFNSPRTCIDIDVFPKLFTELVESEDEKIRKALIDTFQYYSAAKESPYLFNFSKEQILAWLEKQDEKIEPKFKVGDWVVWNNKISCHVDNIYQGKESLMYTVTDVHNMTCSYSVKGFDNNARFWTIQDAKDGDVLSTSTGIGIFIYNGNNGVGSCPECYVGINTSGRFQVGGEIGEKVCPATKERRELLFSKLKEAGYEWDSEKKELKKLVEQEHSEKIEPKFKVGDWIIKNDGKDCFSDGSHILQITDINGLGYKLSNGCYLIEPVTDTYRLWKSGYEWNAEKKELKKVEQDYTEKADALMSLDEAIEHCKGKSCGNNACALEHKQLEKWLTELKELQDQQKPVEKIKPKFKVGDWVINTITKEVEQILELTGSEYLCSGYLIVSYNEQHLLKSWTIQDAKDGDVLATKKGNPFIYDKNRYNNGLAYYYAGLDVNKELTLKSPHHMLGHFGELCSVFPATEKQRDLLFSKMSKAGYEWDAEKKEIKKISKEYPLTSNKCIKAIWSKEDENMLDRAIYMMEQLDMTESWDDVYNWLKSLPERLS